MLPVRFRPVSLAKHLPWMVLMALAFLTPRLFAATASAEALSSIQRVKDAWENAFYAIPPESQEAALEPLRVQSLQLIDQYPDFAEPFILGALVECSLAANASGFGALSHVRKARDLALKALAINPLAFEGSAYVILGNLYYRLPGWPLSFGDNRIARSYLETAVRLYPKGLDSNFFYGDFLLEESSPAAALPYLEKADEAPIRNDSRLSDMKLKEELRVSMKLARGDKVETQGFYNQFLNALGAR